MGLQSWLSGFNRINADVFTVEDRAAERAERDAELAQLREDSARSKSQTRNNDNQA
jgi:hypothetical protein